MKQPAPIFSVQYSPNLPELLIQLGCTIAISTYQAGKVIFISAKNEEELVQLPRAFTRAMGIAVDGDRMAVASQHQVTVLANSPGLAPTYPRQPNTYDALYMPRATYYTGHVDVHDLHWGKAGLWAVNTSFSCLALIDEKFSFRPQWKPPFITKLAAEDRCHLNGLAMRDGEPLFVSALGNGDTFQSWRENIATGGILMHVPSGETVLGNLPMPHSVRIFDDKLFLLFSATGELVCADPTTGKWDVIQKIHAFLRGMDRIGDYLFVGTSSLRKHSGTARHLPIADAASHAGLQVIHLPTGARVAELKYLSSVEEIYDVRILPGTRRPGIMNTANDEHLRGLSTPEATYWGRSLNQE